jgi:hypothetical protein
MIAEIGCGSDESASIVVADPLRFPTNPRPPVQPPITMFFLLAACAVLPLLSFALPSSHTRSLHHRSPSPPRPQIMTYYADWAPPHSIDYSLFDTIIFAFALPNEHCQLVWDSDQALRLLSDLVPVAHAAATKVSLSIGGWTGSRPVLSSLALPTPSPQLLGTFQTQSRPHRTGNSLPTTSSRPTSGTISTASTSIGSTQVK